MGYVCPVCGVGTIDGVQLANHLAVTASLGREDHREWLERHVPDWRACRPPELAERVREHAEEVETPAGGEDPPRFEDALAERSRGVGRGSLAADEDELDAVLAEARELTRRMCDGDETV